MYIIAPRRARRHVRPPVGLAVLSASAPTNNLALAQRAELHLDLDDDLLRELAVRADHTAVTR